MSGEFVGEGLSSVSSIQAESSRPQMLAKWMQL